MKEGIGQARRYGQLFILVLLLAFGQVVVEAITFYVPEGGAIRWYDGSGSSELGGFFLAGGTNAVGRIAVQDRDGDGVKDFIVSQSDASRFYNGSVPYANMAPGGFLTVGGAGITGGMLLQDRTGDGKVDYVIAESDGAVRFYDAVTLKNIGTTGAPVGPGGFLLAGSGTTGVGRIALQDRNGDGTDDYIVPESDGAIRFYDGSSLTNMAPGGFFTVNAPVGGVNFQDRTGDGKVDYIVPEGDAVRFYDAVTLKNIGSTGAPAGPGGFLTVDTPVGRVALLDLNNDGFDDYIVSETGPNGDAVRFYDGQSLANGVAGWGSGFLTSGTPTGGVIIIPPCSTLLNGDIDQDCHVTGHDFALFANDWLECTNKSDPDCNP